MICLCIVLSNITPRSVGVGLYLIVSHSTFTSGSHLASLVTDVKTLASLLPALSRNFHLFAQFETMFTAFWVASCASSSVGFVDRSSKSAAPWGNTCFIWVPPLNVPLHFTFAILFNRKDPLIHYSKITGTPCSIVVARSLVCLTKVKECKDQPFIGLWWKPF